MKVLALIDLCATADKAEVIHRLNEELQASWELYATGVVREAYATDIPTRIVFVLEAHSVQIAESTLQRLPLIQIGYFSIQLTELRPFSNWARLFAPSR